MNSDSFFQQGVTHEVCEDYALHGPGYAIVSDGCSNGGGPRINTDWGARLLCKAAEQHIQREDPNEFAAFVCGTAQTQVNSFPNLPLECLTATLLTIQENGRALVFGDGIVGGRRSDGSWEISIIEFERGGKRNEAAPYYLKYRMVEQEQYEWAKQFGGICSIRTFMGDLLDPKYECPIDFNLDNRTTFWDETAHWLHHSFQWQFSSPFYRLDFPVDKYDFIFVASDGAQSFYEMRKTETKKYNERVHIMDVLRVLLDLRNFRPGFARLQRNWVFKQDRAGTFVRRNWHNGDDVSLGVIHCETET